MKTESRIQALLQLQESLGEDATKFLESSRSTIMNVDNVPIPNYEDAASGLMIARRMKQRSACIDAEIQKIAREEPADTSMLDKEAWYLRRSFSVTRITSLLSEANIGFPDTYSIAKGGGIARSVYVQNDGVNYSWGKDNIAPIVLKLSLQSKPSGEGEEIVRKEWLYELDTSRIAQNIPSESSDCNADYKKEKIFIVEIPENDLANLNMVRYELQVNLYESEISGGMLMSPENDFKGEYMEQIEIKE